MKCKKCHTELPEKAKYCLQCGAKVTSGQASKSRGNGTGTVYRRGKTWTAAKTLGYYVSEDKLHREVRTKGGFKTKREALEYLAILGREPETKTRTFRQVYDLWFPTHQASASTMGCYQAAMKWFKPVWGYKLDYITIEDLQDCMDDCPKGKRTQQNMKAVCGLIYKYAIPRGLARLNLGEYLRVGGTDTGPREGLPEGAVEALERAQDTIPGADYVFCQCYLGYRPSELLTLDASQYDRKEKVFRWGMKTSAGKNRVVTISPKIQPIIDRLTANKIGGPIFCRQDGGEMPIAEYRELFYSVLDAIGVENPVNEFGYHRYTPHSCRHTFATLLKRVKGADKDKLELIGHTSEGMLRHYQDVDLEDLRKITDAL